MDSKTPAMQKLEDEARAAARKFQEVLELRPELNKIDLEPYKSDFNERLDKRQDASKDLYPDRSHLDAEQDTAQMNALRIEFEHLDEDRPDLKGPEKDWARAEMIRKMSELQDAMDRRRKARTPQLFQKTLQQIVEERNALAIRVADLEAELCALEMTWWHRLGRWLGFVKDANRDD